MADEKNEPIIPIDDWVAENYEAMVADEARNLTWPKVAEDAEASGDQNLAAWARRRASDKNVDVTPTTATADAPTKVTRRVSGGDKPAKDVDFPITEPVGDPVTEEPEAPKKSGK